MNLLKTRSLALLVILLPMLYACPKHKPNPAPEPDTEVQSSVDAMFATFLVTDIEMICSFIGEYNFAPDFYMPQPSEDPSHLYAFHQITDNYLVASFNKVKCVDGRSREGSVYLTYANTDQNSNYYHNYKFHGRIALVDFKVDGWLIRTLPGKTCDIYNELSSPTFDPTKTNLSWTIEGSFEIIHPTDASKNMVWTGKLTKTLANTKDPLVYKANRLIPIDWSLAKVEYKGEASGKTAENVAFKLKINEFYPIVREFTCYPNEVGGIESTQPLRTWKKEYHPFKSGVIDFTTDTKYPRVIYLGNEAIAGSMAQCDNSGIVLIKGNSYAVNFN